MGGLLALLRVFGGPSAMLTPPDLPRLPEPPAMPGGMPPTGPDESELPKEADLPAVPPLPRAFRIDDAEGTAAGGRSYASTYDVSVACLPCAQQHTSGAAAAADAAAAAAASGDMGAAKVEALRAVGEVAAFRLFDLTSEKIARTPADALQAIQETMPALSALAESVPAPPAALLAAYAAVAESPRFARGAPTELDRREIAERVLPALRWCGEIERVQLSPDRMAALAPPEHARAERALDEVREARHALGSPDATPSAAALEQASAHLLTAATLLAPDPTPAQIQAMATHAAEAVDALDGHLRAKIVSGLGGAP